jgi:hypothetical protein
MRFALCIKGAHSIQSYCANGFTNRIKLLSTDSFISIKKNIIDVIKEQGHEIDIFISTYDCNACDYLIELYKPVSSYKFDSMYMSSNYRFTSQVNHYLKLVDLINIYEINNKIEYDIVITTRFDIIFNCPYNNLPILYDKFNTTIKHVSGNCDDNLWIFPRKYLNIFRDSCNELLNPSNDISMHTTHYINNILEKYNTPMHFFYDLNINSSYIYKYKEYFIFSSDGIR